MAATYLEILSTNQPFPSRVDENGRVVFSTDYTALACAAVDTFEEDIASHLSASSLGTLGTDLFVGPLSTFPSGAGPYVHIADSATGN